MITIMVKQAWPGDIPAGTICCIEDYDAELKLFKVRPCESFKDPPMGITKGILKDFEPGELIIEEIDIS